MAQPAAVREVEAGKTESLFTGQDVVKAVIRTQGANELLILYTANKSGKIDFELVNGPYCYANDRLTALENNTAYFSADSDVVKMHGIRSGALRHMILKNAPKAEDS